MSTLTLRHLKREHIIVCKCARKSYNEGKLGLKNADRDRGRGEGKVMTTITIMVILNCVVNSLNYQKSYMHHNSTLCISIWQPAI